MAMNPLFILAALGGGAYYLSQKDKKKTTAATPPNNQQKQDSIPDKGKEEEEINEPEKTPEQLKQIEERGYYSVGESGCEDLVVANMQKALKYAFSVGRDLPQQDWNNKLFNGCVFSPNPAKSELISFVYELIRYSGSGGVKSGKMPAAAFSTSLSAFKDAAAKAGVDVSKWSTELVQDEPKLIKFGYQKGKK